MFNKGHYENQLQLKEMINAARGVADADLVVKNVHFLDVFSGQFSQGDVAVKDGTIVGIKESYSGKESIDGSGLFLVPGFIDAHVHIESSLMTPARFQQAVLPEGTTTAIWDPHEIANVWGTEGIEWALRSVVSLLQDIYVMLPSCVPATSKQMGLESGGAHLTVDHLRPFKGHPHVLGLAEMMNYPGLLFGDEEVLSKLHEFRFHKRDGHCPQLTGKDLNAYATAGIHSCHESTGLAEAEEKLMKGIHVLIREGSCAKDADTLLPLLNAYNSSELGFCSDDRNPKDIAEEGHINCIINKALQLGKEPAEVFRAASYAAARAYGLDDRGAIAPGYLADFCLIRPRQQQWRQGMDVLQVFKRGNKVDVSELSKTADSAKFTKTRKNLILEKVTAKHFMLPGAKPEQLVRVIGVRPGQILTDALQMSLRSKDGCIEADFAQDVLKIAVLERHSEGSSSSTALVKGFGLRQGAIATSINHDSHNVIVVGSSDALMAKAVNCLLDIDGGIVVVHEDGRLESLELPIGGLMTDASPQQVTVLLTALKKLTMDAGCQLQEPFLQLSFLALPVIPALKITDRGLVDVTTFQLTSLMVGNDASGMQ